MEMNIFDNLIVDSIEVHDDPYSTTDVRIFFERRNFYLQITVGSADLFASVIEEVGLPLTRINFREEGETFRICLLSDDHILHDFPSHGTDVKFKWTLIEPEEYVDNTKTTRRKYYRMDFEFSHGVLLGIEPFTSSDYNLDTHNLLDILKDRAHIMVVDALRSGALRDTIGMAWLSHVKDADILELCR